MSSKAISQLYFVLLLLALTPGRPAAEHARSPHPDTVTAAILIDFPPLYSMDESGGPVDFASEALSDISLQAGLSGRYPVLENRAQAMEPVRDGKPASLWTPRRIFLAMSSLIALLVGLISWRYFSVANINRRLLHSMAQRDKAYQELEVSEQRFRMLIDQAAEAIFGVDLEGKCSFANPACARLLGYQDVQELIGRKLDQLIRHKNPDSLRHRENEYPASRVLRTGEGVHLTNETLWRVDGTSFPAEYRSYPIRHEGKITSAVVTFADNTERRRMELALRQSEEKYRSLVETTSDWIWEVDNYGVYTYVSPRVTELLGYQPEEILGKKPFDLMPREEAQRVTNLFSALVDARQPIRALENTNLHKDGRRIVLESTGVPIFGPAGEYLGYRGIDRDMTARKQMEEQRRHRELGLARLDQWMRRLDTLTEQPEKFYCRACDAVRNLFDADLATLPLLEKSGQSFLYRAAAGSGAQLLLGKRLPLGPGYLLEAMRKQGKGIRVPMLRKEHQLELGLAPSLHLTTAMVTPLSYKSEVTGGLAAFRKSPPFDEADEELMNLFGQRVSISLANIRLLATLEQSVQARTAELQTSNQELESFSYSVSHDLRAPLRSIDGFSQALLEDYENSLDSTGRNYLRRVRKASQRMGELIDDLLSLSRVIRREMNRDTVDLSVLAVDISTQLQDREPAREAEWRIQDGLHVDADASLLRIALENLLGNAWKYTSREARARIEFGALNQRGGQIYFVRDNGVGFDMQYADKLFGAFQRLHGSEEFEGTGIGLATVYRIIQRHGGRIWAEAQLDGGAAFYFTLS